jgi:hypothetical protein
MAKIERTERLAPPTNTEIFQQLHNLLIYWLSPSEVSQLLAQIAFKELSSPAFLQGISRIVIASNPEGKKTRGLIQALHGYFTREGGTPLEIEARDPEKLSGKLEVSVSSAGLAANWKVDQARRAIAGNFGGDTVLVGTDTIIFAGNDSTSIERFPNPERDRHFAQIHGLPWTWGSIKGQVERVVNKIASREAEPPKEAVVIAHCVTSFARKALAEDAGVLFNLGYSIRTIYWGIKEEQIWRDIEKYRAENTIAHMNKRPPLVKLAEDYRDHITEVDITHLVCGLLADTVGNPITFENKDGHEVLMDPGKEDLRFVRPGLMLQNDGSIQLVDTLGGVQTLTLDSCTTGQILGVIDDSGKRIFSEPTERGIRFLIPKRGLLLTKVRMSLENGTVRQLTSLESNILRTLIEQTQAYEKVLDIVTSFMIDGIPPQVVLAAFLASVAVPLQGNSQEVTVMGYPELLKPTEPDGSPRRETPTEKAQRIRDAYVRMHVGKYSF